MNDQPQQSKAVARYSALKDQLEARGAQFAAALPQTIPAEKFQRVVLTAVTQNPELLDVHRGSLMLACMRAAQDGLLPDGREAALVVFRDRNKGKIAQYIAMVAGVRKLVQQSGEIATFEQHCVFENDIFDVRFGSEALIDHRPMLRGDRGAMVAAYSVATTRQGYKSFEVMTTDEIDKVREVSRAKDAGPWKSWYEEMAKKTVAKRHAKMLPLSSERPLLTDDDDESTTPRTAPGARLTLSQSLDRLANGTDEGDDLDYDPTWSTATDAPPGAEG